jgi:hypothetical protein
VNSGENCFVVLMHVIFVYISYKDLVRGHPDWIPIHQSQYIGDLPTRAIASFNTRGEGDLLPTLFLAGGVSHGERDIRIQ